MTSPWLGATLLLTVFQALVPQAHAVTSPPAIKAEAPVPVPDARDSQRLSDPRTALRMLDLKVPARRPKTSRETASIRPPRQEVYEAIEKEE